MRSLSVHFISPYCRKLYEEPSAMMIWSTRPISKSAAASPMRLVMDMSSGLGAATPEGWLWTMMREEASTSTARFTMSL